MDVFSCIVICLLITKAKCKRNFSYYHLKNTLKIIFMYVLWKTLEMQHLLYSPKIISSIPDLPSVKSINCNGINFPLKFYFDVSFWFVFCFICSKQNKETCWARWAAGLPLSERTPEFMPYFSALTEPGQHCRCTTNICFDGSIMKSTMYRSYEICLFRSILNCYHQRPCC